MSNNELSERPCRRVLKNLKRSSTLKDPPGTRSPLFVAFTIHTLPSKVPFKQTFQRCLLWFAQSHVLNPDLNVHNMSVIICSVPPILMPTFKQAASSYRRTF